VFRGLVSILGTLPPAWLAAALVALVWPAPEGVRLSLAFVLAIPFWVAAMCVALLDWRVWRAAVASVAITAAAYAAIVASR
jgi:hypothetical protein